VRVGAWKFSPSASSLRVPSSEVKSPSFILEPASRGDLESGLDIFNLLAGWSMVDTFQNIWSGMVGGNKGRRLSRGSDLVAGGRWYGPLQ
jgi:hypothetical protein